MRLPSMAPFVSLALILSFLPFTQPPASRGTFLSIAVRVPYCGSGPPATLVAVHPNGSFSLNGVPTNPSELNASLQRMFENRVERLLFVKGDPTSTFRDVADLFTWAQQHADRVALVTPPVEHGSDCLTINPPPTVDPHHLTPAIDLKPVAPPPWPRWFIDHSR